MLDIKRDRQHGLLGDRLVFVGHDEGLAEVGQETLEIRTMTHKSASRVARAAKPWLVPLPGNE